MIDIAGVLLHIKTSSWLS